MKGTGKQRQRNRQEECPQEMREAGRAAASPPRRRSRRMPTGNARSGSVCEIVIRSRRRRRPPTDATAVGGWSRDRPKGIVIRSRRPLSSTGRRKTRLTITGDVCRRAWMVAILIMVVDFGIQIEIGIGIDEKDGNSTPTPTPIAIAISISTGRMRSKLELLEGDKGTEK